MNTEDRGSLNTVSGASVALYVIVTIAAVFFLSLGTVIVVEKPGQWQLLAVSAAVTAVLYVCLRVMRLEVAADGITYRSIFGTQFAGFSEIERAYYKADTYDPQKPVSRVRLFLQTRAGNTARLNLRVFPIEAAAICLLALEDHDIEVEKSSFLAARRFDDQIGRHIAEMQGIRNR